MTFLANANAFLNSELKQCGSRFISRRHAIQYYILLTGL